ncbi:hypothetical protein F5B19DRAFT_161403 [Rostrohypoxylon terebratum]|nr:hypothetical protein F5B19DRAFT_161403 [Rostrohypoxylon terebratum]
MEVNTLFHVALLSFGYQVYMAGARVFDKETDKYGGFEHCVNIVTIGNRKYMVDVGFGPNGPISPLLLEHDRPQRHIPTDTAAMVRLVYEPLPQAMDQSQKVWVYQQRISPEAEWVPWFCFVDIEFLPEDINVLNYYTWRSPTSWFTQKVIVSRFTTNLERDSEEELNQKWGWKSQYKTVDEGMIDGQLTIFHDSLKWRRDGKVTLDVKLESEEQRIRAIWKYFGIDLEEEDRLTILGTVGDIK